MISTTGESNEFEEFSNKDEGATKKLHEFVEIPNTLNGSLPMCSFASLSICTKIFQEVNASLRYLIKHTKAQNKRQMSYQSISKTLGSSFGLTIVRRIRQISTR